MIYRAWAPLRRKWQRGSVQHAVSGAPFRKDIQGLRAVAVLLVVVGHSGVPFLQGGYVGVDVFFVLSGYLITGLLLTGVERVGYVSFWDFYSRRARRILPAATLTLLSTIVASQQVLNVVRAREAIWDSLYAAVFLANVRFAERGTDYFSQGQPPSPVQHYWSLSIEEQFYFVWPALIALVLLGVRQRRKASVAPMSFTLTSRIILATVIGCAGIASLTWSVHETQTQPAAAYFSTMGRVWELALGAIVAITVVAFGYGGSGLRIVLGWAGIGAVLVAGMAYSSATPFPGWAALLPTLGTALVIVAGISSQPRYSVGRLLSTAPLRYVGDRSYAFYLWHWPILVLASQYMERELTVVENLLLMCGAFALSIVSYALVENPIRRSRRKTTTSTVLIPASVGLVFVIAIVALQAVSAKLTPLDQTARAARATSGILAPATAGRAKTDPAVVRAVAAARRASPIPKTLVPSPDRLLDRQYLYDFPSGCVPTATQTRSDSICRLGDAAATKSIVLFGDSHAQMWMPTILAMADADGWIVIPVVKSGCVPSAWTGRGYPGTQAAILRQCHSWYRWALQKTKSLRPDVVVMAGCCGGADGTTALDTKRAFSSLARSLGRVAKSIVLVADDDGVHRDPVDCLLAKGATMRTCTSTWTAQRFALNDDLATIADKAGYEFLNTRVWFCFEFECPMVVGRTVVYRDTGHITRPYALRLASQFRAAFRRCVFDACPR